MKHRLPDLVSYVHAQHEASMAAGILHDERHADPATVAGLHRKALAAVHRQHAAMVMLGLDPLCPHPLRMQEVFDQINEAEVSIWHLRKKEKKVR